MNKIEKLNKLNEIVVKKYKLSLKEIIEEENMDDILNGKKEISEEKLKDIASLFYLDVDVLTDNNKEIPFDSLQVDELVINIRQGEYINEVGKKKNRHLLKRNYHALDHKNKKKLWVNLVCTTLPLIAFVLFSFVRVVIDSTSTLNTYKEGNKLSSEQQKIEDSLDDTSIFTSVNTGAQIESITNISSANSSYQVTMILRFDFSQYDFHKTWWYKEKGEEFNSDNLYTEQELLEDNWCFNSTGDGWLNYPDNIPDVIQFNFNENTDEKKPISKDNSPTSISSLYTDERKAYPGEKSSNIFTDKNDEFFIGNGKIQPDSLEYLDKGTSYIQDGDYRFYQKLHFTATINKKFDSPRYPLDSAQFHIYIQPTRNTDFIRYIPDTEMSGYTNYFNITDGYRLINEKEDIKNFTLKLNYYQESDKDKNSTTFNETITKSQLEVIVRANKTGLSVFINNFLNIIAVAIWLILAFFNQSFNKEDSISMIGTGFFSAISAILLGFSLSSSSNIFSLLSLINIFTLVMVLIMGYESISAKRIKSQQNASDIAYKFVRMRVLFYFFVIASFIIYLLLPIIAYLWII